MDKSLLSYLDFGVIGFYFLLVFGIAVFVTLKDRKKKSIDSDDYFLAGRNLGWFVIGASLFASNIGSEHLIGLAGSGAKGDFVNGQFEILAALILLLLGWVFVPFYLKSGVYTMPEFLEKRYSPSSRTYLSLVSILAYVITKISVTVFAGALVFDVMLGLPFWKGAILVVVATGVYTIFGGLRAVIYTDLIQTFILLGGAIAVTYFGLDALGGWGELKTIITNEATEPSHFFSLWRPFEDSNYPWTGVLFGAPILGVWYWCTDQFIVQRVLSAKDVSNARKGTIFAGFLKLLPIFLFVIPGVVAFALSSQHPTMLLDINGDLDYDTALPALIRDFLPSGLRGLVTAGLLAALMSSLSSVFNSCSTLFTMDFYKKWRPNSSEKTFVRVGQLSTLVLVIIGLLWIPAMETLMEGEGIFKYLQSIQAYISPPIAAAFLLGIFYKRINSRGANAALYSGLLIGMARLALEYISKSNPTSVLAMSFDWFVGVNFLHFALFLFIFCAIVMVAVSLATAPPDYERIKAITYSRGTDASRATLFASKEFYFSIILIICVIILWVWFSPLGMA